MKLISFDRQGVPGFGAVLDGGVLDLGKAAGGAFADLRSLITAGPQTAAMLVKDRGPDYRLDEVTYLPVIPNPGKIWCAGLNYAEHVAETRNEATEKPTFFLRIADSQVGHNGAIERPMESACLDFEGEIAIVIGKEGRRISPNDAWDYIAGYSCYNDVSVRDWQKHTSQWCPGKNFYRTGGFGPWMVTSDEIPPRAVLKLVTRLNGEVVQSATTDMMLNDIPALIAYTSTIAPLRPGDVIVTGTPGGIGSRRTPPLWMKPGDTVEVEVDRIGVLSNIIVDASAG